MWTWVVLAALAATPEMARVEGGVYRPLFPVDPEKPCRQCGIAQMVFRGGIESSKWGAGRLVGREGIEEPQRREPVAVPDGG